MLAQAQSHRQFLVTQFRMIRRKIGGKIAFIVAGPAPDGTFEQPFANLVLRATADPADLAEQRGNMHRLTQSSGERHTAQWTDRFHWKTIARPG